MGRMWFRRFKQNLKHYCKNITLHGCVNISESKSLLDMIFWFVVLASCFGLCLWLMAIHCERYLSRPTVTTIKSTTFPITNLLFPAVTLCNTNVVYRANIQYYENMLIKEGINQSKINDYFKILSNLIYVNSTVTDYSQFDEIEKLWEKNEISSEILMKSVMQPCENLLVNCSWSGTTYNCSDMFRPIKTELGFCCSFNYFGDISDKYKKNAPVSFRQPVSAEGAGISHGLDLKINIDTDNYFSSLLPFYTCLVMIHSTLDYGDLSSFAVMLQPNDYALMQLNPTVYSAEENLRKVDVSQRRCRFMNEGHLESSRDYSFANCVVECKSKAIYDRCKCVPYYYFPLGKRAQCTLQDAPCLKKHELLHNNLKLAGKIIHNATNCDCLPQCDYVIFNGYINKVNSDLHKQHAVINIHFDESWCVEYGMSLNVTWDMLLASLGGIFGLCLGGSLISLIECVYYLVKSVIVTFAQEWKVSAINSSHMNKKGVKQLIVIKPKY